MQTKFNFVNNMRLHIRDDKIKTFAKLRNNDNLSVNIQSTNFLVGISNFRRLTIANLKKNVTNRNYI